MLKIRIDLISARDPTRDKTHQTIEIANIGGTKTLATYRYRIFSKSGKLMATGTVENVPRRQFLAVDLLTLCLVDARGQKVLRKMRK